MGKLKALGALQGAHMDPTSSQSQPEALWAPEPPACSGPSFPHPPTLPSTPERPSPERPCRKVFAVTAPKSLTAVRMDSQLGKMTGPQAPLCWVIEPSTALGTRCSSLL